jgi:hypothetical protein
MNRSKPLEPGGQPEQVEELEREIQRLEAENERLRKKIEDLEGELRAGKRQAAPFCKGQPKANPKPPGRKPGQGNLRYRPAPAEAIGDAIDAKHPIAGQRVLIVRPDHLRDVVATDLTRRGATVTDLIAYQTTAASPGSAARPPWSRSIALRAFVVWGTPPSFHSAPVPSIPSRRTALAAYLDRLESEPIAGWRVQKRAQIRGPVDLGDQQRKAAGKRFKRG